MVILVVVLVVVRIIIVIATSAETASTTARHVEMVARVAGVLRAPTQSRAHVKNRLGIERPTSR